jgi:hypothetical protein
VPSAWSPRQLSRWRTEDGGPRDTAARHDGRVNPSSGFVVRVEHLPDRTYRLWLQTSGDPLDLGTVGRTRDLHPTTKSRVAAHAGVPVGELGAVELFVPAPPWFRVGQPVLVHDDDGTWAPGYVMGFVQGGFLVDTEHTGGIYPQERIDFDPPTEAMTYRGRHRE